MLLLNRIMTHFKKLLLFACAPIKITGHGDMDILKKYIKADHLDVVQKFTDKYDYFD